jgi:hypothetical protein
MNYVGWDDLICPLSKLTQHNIKVINKLKNSFKWGITFVLYQNLPKQSGFFFLWVIFVIIW